ncbi:MAG: sulfite exporter TauE/SafE family protein [Deltaproteobacteria bacterium]|nr:sulfite exporter TauE/SafE family protein [Candidatus Zymogenaceae bacterium]
MDTQLSIFVAFWAGIVSFISPCVLPLLPSYLTFITGMSFDELTGENKKSVRRATVLHSIFFIIGFSIVFTALGALFGLMGGALFTYKEIIRKIGAVLLIVLGIYISGLIRMMLLRIQYGMIEREREPGPILSFFIRLFSLMDTERKVHLKQKPAGFIGSSLVGITFAAGWSPCLGPIVAAILSLAVIGESSNALYGVVLLLVFSLGLGLPFLLASLAFNSFLALFNRFKRFIPAVNIVAGLLLVVLGVFLFTTGFEAILTYIL